MKRWSAVFLCALLFCFVLGLFSSCAPKTEQLLPADEPASPALSAEAPAENPPQEGVEAPASRVRFFATGDNIIHTGIWRQANRNAGGSGNGCLMNSEYDFAPFYENLRNKIEGADIAFLNQESLVAADESGEPLNYPAFNTPRALGDTMVDFGFDVVCIANNHMLDMGANGLKNSIEYWNSKEQITLVGGYLDQKDFETIRVVEKNGVKIAILAYAEDPNNSALGLGVELSYYQPYSSLGLYVPALNEGVLRRQVAQAQALADFVIVSMHWGEENTDVLSATQRYFADLCAGLGVDLVLGSHPHVIQAMEWKPSSTPSGKTLVIYSMGNLINLMEGEGNMIGGLFSCEFVKENGTRAIENPVFSPVVSHTSADYRTIYLANLYDENAYTGTQGYTAAEYATHYIHRYCRTDLDRLSEYYLSRIPEEFRVR